MTRRQVLQAGIAALFAPVVRWERNAADRRGELLAAFCGEHHRWSFSRPFAKGGLTYATDAMQICRAELPCATPTGEQRRIPDVESLWTTTWQPAAWRPFALPPIESLVRRNNRYCKTCPLCGNRRVSLGASYPSNDWLLSAAAGDCDYDIDTNTIRDASCPLCRGREYRGPDVVEIAGLPFTYYAMRKIAALPHVRVCRSRAPIALPRAQVLPLLFRADGFEGMAMPLDLPYRGSAHGTNGPRAREPPAEARGLQKEGAQPEEENGEGRRETKLTAAEGHGYPWGASARQRKRPVPSDETAKPRTGNHANDCMESTKQGNRGTPGRV